MKKSYLDYSMSVLVGRALPDVRDGLKPVHRRILYSMYEQKLTHQRPYKKSATVVGDVLGKYHPHGDGSVYDAMVRMAQDFSLLHPMVQGQGNFGSVDGDPAAAYRYTEARMAQIGEEMLSDIDKNTVGFEPNFDQRLKEPEVLPSGYPNLLVNGSSGIAVGMATNIPPHNLRDTIKACLEIIRNPGVSDDKLFDIVKAPDFPTGGIIMGLRGVRDAFRTGRGRIIIRSRVSSEEVSGRNCLIVSEIPYMVNKARLIKSIADLVKDKKITGIADLRDESDRQGMRIVIVLKRDAIEDVVLNQLFKHTALETSFGANLIALVDKIPRRLSLRDMISLYVEHRHSVIERRCRFEYDKAEARAHILRGLIKAQDNIDEVIRIIRGSASQAEAKAELMSRFDFTEKQTQAILDMRLGKLTALDRKALEDELHELEVRINELKEILASKNLRMEIVAEELEKISDKYGQDRKSDIVPWIPDEINVEDMIPNDPMVVMVSHRGYIKRLPVDTWRSQIRGGRGKTGVTTRDEDFLEQVFTATNHSCILFFTNRGRCYWLKVWKIPEAGRNSMGKALINLLELLPEERPVASVCVNDFQGDRFVLMATSDGRVKKTPLVQYSHPRRVGIKAIKLHEDTELVQAIITDGKSDIIMASRSGRAIRFSESELRPLGRDTSGVMGMNLEGDDRIVDLVTVTGEEELMTVTADGYGKRTPVSEYRETHRAGKGIINIKTDERNGGVVAVSTPNSDSEMLLVTESGMVIRIRCAEVRTIGRATKGVKLINLHENDTVSDAALLQDDMTEPEEVSEDEGADA
ncbi:DNA gyrase subunit A [Candidatus Fermentibacteria bacterium]|nr:MAG: DNA gyrase subunit A [Candidatus Fermentibacteria bacterium]PIE52354.1 MAG: DNA gyrase subunit A [Candidatus Fermentibacteria bacterium]